MAAFLNTNTNLVKNDKSGGDNAAISIVSKIRNPDSDQ